MTMSAKATMLVVDDEAPVCEVVEEYFVAVIDRVVGLEMGADDELPCLSDAVRRVIAGSGASLERSAR
jgi:hypothetical protein